MNQLLYLTPFHIDPFAALSNQPPPLRPPLTSRPHRSRRWRISRHDRRWRIKLWLRRHESVPTAPAADQIDCSALAVIVGDMVYAGSIVTALQLTHDPPLSILEPPAGLEPTSYCLQGSLPTNWATAANGNYRFINYGFRPVNQCHSTPVNQHS